jgi:hypothetical protein
MAMILSGHINEHHVTIDTDTCVLTLVLTAIGFEQRYRLPNLVVLSETLRDTVGYGPALDFVTQHDPEGHFPDLRRLGRKG